MNQNNSIPIVGRKSSLEKTNLSAKQNAEKALETHKQAQSILEALVEIEEKRAIVWHDIKAMRKLKRSPLNQSKQIAANRAYTELNGLRKQAISNYNKYCAHALEFCQKVSIS